MFTRCLSHLATYYDRGEARAILRLLAEEKFHLSWTDVLCGALDGLSAAQQQELWCDVERVAAGEPVQYVLGVAEFCSLRLKVAPGVLIPRIETEELVEEALLTAGDTLRVMDIGTGSGCIALAIAHRRPQWQVTGIDISSDALAIARDNRQLLNIGNVSFVSADILDMAATTSASSSDGNNHDSVSAEEQWDIIISNPPYIRRSEAAEMERHVLDHEPHQALFVDSPDPLLFYRAIARYALRALRPDGRLLFEINSAFGSDTCALLTALGFRDVTLRQDQFGRDRIVCCRR